MMRLCEMSKKMAADGWYRSAADGCHRCCTRTACVCIDAHRSWARAILKNAPIVVLACPMESSKENVYAGGDTVTGAATVILAMGAGKRAAAAIDEKLSAK